MKSIKSYISNSNWSNFQMPTTFQGCYISVLNFIFYDFLLKFFKIKEENEEDESQDVSDSQSSKI